jgi:hypothetical protein
MSGPGPASAGRQSPVRVLSKRPPNVVRPGRASGSDQLEGYCHGLGVEAWRPASAAAPAPASLRALRLRLASSPARRDSAAALFMIYGPGPIQHRVRVRPSPSDTVRVRPGEPFPVFPNQTYSTTSARLDPPRPAGSPGSAPLLLPEYPLTPGSLASGGRRQGMRETC